MKNSRLGNQSHADHKGLQVAGINELTGISFVGCWHRIRNFSTAERSDIHPFCITLSSFQFGESEKSPNSHSNHSRKKSVSQQTKRVALRNMEKFILQLALRWGKTTALFVLGTIIFRKFRIFRNSVYSVLKNTIFTTG